MFRVAVGEVLDSTVTSWPEGVQYSFDAGGHWLMMYLPDPTDVEIDAVQQQPVEFGLFLRDGVVFLLFKYGVLPWSDAPYSYWLVGEDHRKIPEIEEPPESHGFLKTILVDSNTGVVKAIRALTFSVEFTSRLHQAIREQTEQTNWSHLHHNSVIMQVAQDYPSSEDMLWDTVVMCNGGD